MTESAPILAFDLETIPDAAGIRAVLDLPDSLSDADAAEAALKMRRQATGQEDAFLQLPLHRVAVISCVLRTPGRGGAGGRAENFFPVRAALR